MAYDFVKNENGDRDLVISGWEQGIAESPYLGIANMRNLNTSWYPGVAYTAYKRIRVNSAGGNVVFTASDTPSFLQLSGALTIHIGDAVTFTTTGTLPSPLMTSTTYFVSQLNTNGPGTFQVSNALGGPDEVILDTGSGVHTVTLITMGPPAFTAQNNSDAGNPAGTIYILDRNGRVWQNTATVDSLPYFVLLDGNTLGGPDSLGLAFYSNYLFVFRGTSIDVNGDGTGSITAALWTNDWFANTPVTFTVGPSAGDIMGTLTTPWAGPTGFYKLTFVNESVTAFLETNNDVVTWVPPLLMSETSSANVNLGNSGRTHMALVGIDNILYFCNGEYIGAISTPVGRKFDKQLVNTGTSILNYATLVLPKGSWSTWLAEQQLNLMIAAQNLILPWDRISTGVGIPLPITEDISRLINISNTIYALAGRKGNVYKTNGYSISIARKIPDSIAMNAIDPSWNWGGIISHRQKLYLTVLAKNGQTGANILNGILSIDDKEYINFENQNSNGLTNASATADAIMFDVDNTDRDSYYSAWYDGTTGGVDYNSTTLYNAGEPVIETDIIPIGTFAQSKTFSNMEFKLDQPMRSGDSISIYARQSLSDSYTLVGTTTTAVLSDFYQPLNFQKWQWVQFKIVISCNPDATLSSFVRLREIRIT